MIPGFFWAIKRLPAQAGKRPFMDPGGRFGPENDRYPYAEENIEEA